DLPGILEEAIGLAQAGRPGPVWIDIPKDILLSEIEAPAPACTEAPSADCPEIGPALAMLKSARRPLLYSGGGVSLAGAEDRFRTFAEVSGDRKSTRLNSSHVKISYAVFCLKKKKVKE